MTPAPPRITVVGSINLDLVVQCDRLPTPGETVLGKSFSSLFGGKEANQAVASAKAGGRTAMIGRVGDDNYAQQLLGNLKSHEIDFSAIQQTSNCSSGCPGRYQTWSPTITGRPSGY